MSKTKRRWIELDPTNPDSLRSEHISYVVSGSNNISVKDELDILSSSSITATEYFNNAISGLQEEINLTNESVSALDQSFNITLNNAVSGLQYELSVTASNLIEEINLINESVSALQDYVNIEVTNAVTSIQSDLQIVSDSVTALEQNVSLTYYPVTGGTISGSVSADSFYGDGSNLSGVVTSVLTNAPLSATSGQTPTLGLQIDDNTLYVEDGILKVLSGIITVDGGTLFDEYFNGPTIDGGFI